MCSNIEGVLISNVFSYSMCSHTERVLVQNILDQNAFYNRTHSMEYNERPVSKEHM